ncbi:hypothetical protein [Achromobacter xylosoxidans]|uniref:hypothetical protein n=1 Tax=Alcaligenes xylosoxydans xylosoxydans TaxID=85698 RepID=UPI0011AE2E93|nr:hypothetical protein [Achromobacter xylosoxidans]QKQ53277.1 hypothetical protein FOC83_10100 [Achromobacter xylosoxidans]QPR97577.1 hypothetical protein I6G72_13930 [Achromobacter xylosoxidans]UON41519.1 hypothetical protein IUJ48_05045 [Achromobacter xylosoxidans]
MTEVKFDDWRLTGFWVGVSVATAIAGFVLGWCWRDRPGVLASVSFLNVMTAVGTVGATVAAVAVPMYQNWDRRREQRLNQLLADWAIAEEVHRVSGRVRDIAGRLQDIRNTPPLATVQHLYAQLEIAKQGATERLGRLIIADLLDFTNTVQAEIEQRLESKGTMMGDMTSLARLKNGLSTELERADQLHQSTYRCMERILVQFKKMNAVPPFFVMGSGTANMSLNAKKST